MSHNQQKYVRGMRVKKVIILEIFKIFRGFQSFVFFFLVAPYFSNSFHKRQKIKLLKIIC